MRRTRFNSSRKVATCKIAGANRAVSHSDLRFVVPWPTVALVVIGVPLLAAVTSGAATRSRLPAEAA